MKPLTKLVLLAASAAAIGCGGQLLAQAGTPRSATRAQPSDFPPDPAIRSGTLPNGMRYALRQNALPPGQIALRMRIGAGSMVERDDQQGFAHFLEHLTYRGTTNMPGNEVIQRLQREGTRVRATTGFTETMYVLDLPRGEASLDTGLHVLREMVSEATLAPDVIDQERGVIQGEQRSKDEPFIREQTARLQFVAPRLGARMPIGDMNIIRTASREHVAKFYDAYYRPSRTTLVAVGDFDLDRTEAQIRRRFADWTPKGPAGPNADRREAERRAPQARIVVEAGANPSLTLSWIRPPDRSPDSRAKRRRALLQRLGIAVLRDRVGHVSRSDAAPFGRAGVRFDDTFGAAQAVDLVATYTPGRLDAALAAAEQAPRQLLRYGVTDAELRRQVSLHGIELERGAAGVATRSSGGYADEIMRAIGKGDVPIGTQTELALFDATVEGLSAVDVTRAMQSLFADAGPLVTITTPAALPGGEAAVLARLAAARRLPVSPPVLQAEVAWPYADFGKPGTVASRRQNAEIDATVVTFANGTVLTVKPTKFEKGRILVAASTGLGERAMTADRVDPLYGASRYMTAGGLGKLTTEQLDYLLTGRTVSYDVSVQSTKFSWSGQTSAEDLALQMQLLAAFITDPGLRPEPLERFKAGYAASVAGAASSPSEVLRRHVIALTVGGDKRRSPPSLEEVRALDMKIAGPRLREAIGQGPVRVVMVGDVTVDQAIAATASTFGALPPRPALPTLPVRINENRSLPGGGGIVQLHHAGPATQALAAVIWPGPARIDREFRHAEMLGEILQFRVSESIRDRLGLAYVPSAGFGGSNRPHEPGQFAASAETTPQNTAAFHAAMDGIARDLGAGSITPDEVSRARTGLIKRAQAEPASNRYWLNALERGDAGPAFAAELPSQIADYETVTPVDVQALARKYLKPETAWRASVLPSSPPQTSAAPPPRG